MANEKRKLICANALKVKGFADPETGEGIIYVQDIDEAPTVDAVEVVHGRWHDIYQVSSWCSTGRCSACEEVAILPIRGLGTPYCPYCGAKMDGERK